jgi:hypothetical protein
MGKPVINKEATIAMYYNSEMFPPSIAFQNLGEPDGWNIRNLDDPIKYYTDNHNEPTIVNKDHQIDGFGNFVLVPNQNGNVNPAKFAPKPSSLISGINDVYRIIYRGGQDVISNIYFTELSLDLTPPYSYDDSQTVMLTSPDILGSGYLLGYDDCPDISPDGQGFVFSSQYLSHGDIYFVYATLQELGANYTFDNSGFLALRITNDGSNTKPKISKKLGVE